MQFMLQLLATPPITVQQSMNCDKGMRNKTKMFSIVLTGLVRLAPHLVVHIVLPVRHSEMHRQKRKQARPGGERSFHSHCGR